MAQAKNPYAVQFGNYTNGRIRFGTLDPKTNTINSVQIESGGPNQRSAHYISLHETGKLAGGITNRCPGVFQIECGDAPVDNTGMVLRSNNGDIIIGAPGSRVRIYGASIDLIARGSDSKTGNVKVVATNKVLINGKKLELTGSSSSVLTSKGNVYVTASNILYLTGSFTKAGTNAILGGVGGLPRILTNNGPTELLQTVQKLFKEVAR